MKPVNILYMSDQFLSNCRNTLARAPDAYAYVPARPMGWSSLPVRLRAVWLVFTGRADALVWEQRQ